MDGLKWDGGIVSCSEVPTEEDKEEKAMGKRRVSLAWKIAAQLAVSGTRGKGNMMALLLLAEHTTPCGSTLPHRRDPFGRGVR